MRVRLAIGGAFALLALALVTLLLGQGSTLAGENGKMVVYGPQLRPGSEVCQDNQVVPREAGRLRVWVSTGGRRAGPIAASVTSASGAPITSGAARFGFRDQPVDIALGPIAHEYGAADVCIRNEGHVPIAVMGDYPTPSDLATRLYGPAEKRLLYVNQVPARLIPRPPHHWPRVVLRLEWRMQAGHSWLGLAPTIGRRLAIAKPSFVGSWLIWLVAAMVVAIGALVAWTLQREAVV